MRRAEEMTDKKVISLIAKLIVRNSEVMNWRSMRMHSERLRRSVPQRFRP